MAKVLSLGTGREFESVNKRWMTPDTVIHHVDMLYAMDADSRYNELKWELRETSEPGSRVHFHGMKILEFLESYPCRDFDEILAQRVFEHIPVTEISYMLYLLRCIAADGAELNIIVPDFTKVFEKISLMDPEKMCASEFNRSMIEVTTEMFNEPNDPHCSIWTPAFARYYIELEKYWKVAELKYVTLDNRDWYMSITANRIN